MTLRVFLFLGVLSACTGEAGVADDGGDDGTDPAGDPTLVSIRAGRFAPIAPYTTITGQAILASRTDGTTAVSIAVAGLGASRGFGAHVHDQPCAYQGGGHYKIDPTVLDTVEANELWLVPESNAVGAAATTVTFSHRARGDALSIVVHDPGNGNARMACADLLTDEDAYVTFMSGPLVAFSPPDVPGDAAITGRVDLARNPTRTQIVLELAGLDHTRTYASHVHAAPCNIDKGRGHYKLDPTVTATEPANEIWVAITDFPDGSTTGSTDVAHGMRTDGQSLVVHRLDGATNPKVACADLARTTPYPSVVTTGAAVELPGGAGLGLAGNATMIRSLTGTTEVALDIAGLAPGTSYTAHVHDQPCAVEAGGGHYMIDRAAAPGEANELWLALTAGPAGTAGDSVRVAHTARADAQAVVLHGADGARLACFDLR